MSTARTAKYRESNKKEMLALLAKGYGISEMCRKLGITRPTYYNWRKKDPHFDHECQRILDDPAHKERILKGASRTDVTPDLPWQQKFLRSYRITGDKNEAANASGMKAREVEDALNPKSENYDEEFHLGFLEEEQRRIWQIEDNLHKKAEHDGPSARFVLANLLKEKYGKVEGQVNVHTTQWFTQKGTDEASEFLSGLFGSQDSHEMDRGRVAGPDQGIAGNAKDWPSSAEN